MFGFAASALFRLLLALGFAGGTALLVWAVERDRPAPAAISPTATESVTRTMSLRLEATFPVVTWTITGGTIADQYCEERIWRGTVTAPAGGELLVEATGQVGVLGFQGVKACLGSRETALWGESPVVGTVKVP